MITGSNTVCFYFGRSWDWTSTVMLREDLILQRFIGNRLDEDQMETHVLAKALYSNGCLSNGTSTKGGPFCPGRDR